MSFCLPIPVTSTAIVCVDETCKVGTMVTPKEVCIEASKVTESYYVQDVLRMGEKADRFAPGWRMHRVFVPNKVQP